MKALQLHVTGIVQGVGFRPYVYKLAGELSLHGWVLNASDGVHIHIEGSDALVDSFPRILEVRAQQEVPAASIEGLSIRSAPVNNSSEFEIRPSVVDVNERTFISPDVATCPSCVAELYSEEDRRHRYPFTNCTDCGPRFTIIEDTPYDRPKTSMRAFSLCTQCQEEYDDPNNRRFHAQPNACFVCGPRLYFNKSASLDEQGEESEQKIRKHWDWSLEEEQAQLKQGPKDTELERARSNSILIEATETLMQGQILALKGLGGFQLACNAQSEMAVARLRDRKARWGKPLAVMFANIEQAMRYAHINADERAILEGNVRPIVLCKRREKPLGAPDLALSVAPSLSEIGVMLPYTPLHHLLLEEFYGPVVMTSGNASGSPIVCDNASALEELRGIADAFLLHDRPIVGRYDDSVVRVIGGRIQMIRRARGYAPMPIKHKAPQTIGQSASSKLSKEDSAEEVPAILAVGAEQKNSFTLAEKTIPGEVDYSFVSQHIGDLENSGTLAAFEDSIVQYERLFKITPQIIAHDLHPEYLSTKWAKVQEEQRATGNNPLRLIGVQHHHAHLIAAAAEHSLEQPFVGLAFDGTGYGLDGSIWGGEVLAASTAYPQFERFAHLRPFSLPGGAGAIKRPIRTLYALLDQYELRTHPAAASIERRLEKHEGATILAMVEKGLNTPRTSSMGRLFDAVSSLLGVADEASFEGSPAMMLESISSELDSRHTPPHYRFGIRPASELEYKLSKARVVIDPEPVFRALLDDLARMEDPDSESELTTAELARRFHDSVVTMIGDVSTKAARHYDLDSVVLAGGVFMNRLIISGARQILEDKGLEVFSPEQLPVNDGSISFGQSVVARAVLAAEEAA